MSAEPPVSLSPSLLGEMRANEKAAVDRFFREPFMSLPWLRADLTFEVQRYFTNYSGDISGRFIELMSIISHGKPDFHPEYQPLLREIPKLQCPDGHFGDPTIDWNGNIDRTGPDGGKYLPTLWGNSRMMCGLVEAYKLTGEKKLLDSAVKLAGFYTMIGKRLTDPERVEEFTGIDAATFAKLLEQEDATIASVPNSDIATSASGYVTDFFPILEGLVKLYRITRDPQHLELAERIAKFYRVFDIPTTRHAHGMLCSHYGYLLLHEETGKKIYLDRVEKRWQEMIQNGFINPAGGLPEGFRFRNDEGCALNDWLRVNLKLYDMTKNVKYLDMADRLVHNHFLVNEWSTGGFGHRALLCDNNGTFGFGEGGAEAVWCCNYHGTLGFETFKKSLVAFDGTTLQIRFAENFESDFSNGNQFTSAVTYHTDKPRTDIAIQRITFRDAYRGRLEVRIPDWAESVTLWIDGKPLKTESQNGFVRTLEAVEVRKEFTIQYNGGLCVEDRRFQKIDLAVIPSGESRQVLFRFGPYVYVAKGVMSIPLVSMKPANVQDRFVPKSVTDMKFDAVLARHSEVQQLVLERFGFGTEQETGVFVFEMVNAEVKVPQTINVNIVSKTNGELLAIDRKQIGRDGGNAQLERKKSADDQQRWMIQECGDGYVKIVNVESGKLLSESGDGDPHDGRKVHQWYDVNSPLQFWKILPSDKESKGNRLLNKLSGRLLTSVPDSSDPKKTDTVIWQDDGRQEQYWIIEKTDKSNK